MYRDVARFYPICNQALHQLYDEVKDLPLQKVRTLKDMIKNFIKITEDLQTSIGGMISQLKDCPMTMVDFLHVDSFVTYSHQEIY
jgi:ribosomal protein S13